MRRHAGADTGVKWKVNGKSMEGRMDDELGRLLELQGRIGIDRAQSVCERNVHG